jgi:hypothetical protein
VGTVTVPIDIENNQAAVTDVSTIAAWRGVNWSLIFSPDKLPELSTDNKLDSTKLLNVTVLVMYTSNM